MTSVPPGAPVGGSASGADQAGGYPATNVATQGGASGGYNPSAYEPGHKAARRLRVVRTTLSHPPRRRRCCRYDGPGYLPDHWLSDHRRAGWCRSLRGSGCPRQCLSGPSAGIHTADATAAPGYGSGANNMPASGCSDNVSRLSVSRSGSRNRSTGRRVCLMVAAGAPAAATPGYGAAGQSYPATGAASGYPAQGGATPAQGGAYSPAGYPTPAIRTAILIREPTIRIPTRSGSREDTGYNPGGTPPYQNTAPAVSTPASSERRDPNWRPGSTSDFSPTRTARGNSGVMSAGYETPISGNSAQRLPTLMQRVAQDILRRRRIAANPAASGVLTAHRRMDRPPRHTGCRRCRPEVIETRRLKLRCKPIGIGGN